MAVYGWILPDFAIDTQQSLDQIAAIVWAEGNIHLVFQRKHISNLYVSS